MMKKMDTTKQLLKEAFQAGHARCAGDEGHITEAPSFEEWYQSKLKNNGDLGDVVGQSEQLPTDRDKIEALINHLEPKFKDSEKS